MRALLRKIPLLIATMTLLPMLAPAATKTAKFNVTATVQSDCTISATNLAFGTVGLLAGNVDATSTITVTCTPATPYAIALNEGDVSGSTVESRKMASGASSMMFQLYRDSARTQVWGKTSGVDTVGNTGNGNPMEITVYGRIPPQNGPAVGAYVAQITATITY
jgi:spore coat protein U-like protein